MDEKRHASNFRFALASLFGLVTACAVLVALLRQDPSATLPGSSANWPKVKAGMSRKQVRQILGDPDVLVISRWVDGYTVGDFDFVYIHYTQDVVERVQFDDKPD
jgi:hypothetical protein